MHHEVKHIVTFSLALFHIAVDDLNLNPSRFKVFKYAKHV